MNEAEPTLEPTQFSQLNRLLSRFTGEVRQAVGDNLAAVYLQGSFALGDADEFSDVDFLVLTNRELSAQETDALQQMHGRLFDADTSWAQHLEGSYAPNDVYRRVDPERQSFLFLDNGSRELVRDSHCNTAVVRWILRENGIVLFGPSPRELIDPVADDDLRREALSALREYVEWAPKPTTAGPMSRWKQPYLVLTFCRILNTIESARVVTKTEAAEWAMQNLDPRWTSMIERALAGRPDPWNRVHERADEGATAETLAFAGYALELGRRREDVVPVRSGEEGKRS